MAIVVRVMYSLFINHSSIVHFQSYSRSKRPTLRRGLGTNNDNLAILDLGCECGVMYYAFLHYENPYSGLARYVTAQPPTQGADAGMYDASSEIH